MYVFILKKGDRVVATAAGNQTYGSAQNVQLTLTYPKSGVGNVLTYVQVTVQQVKGYFIQNLETNNEYSFESLHYEYSLEHKLRPRICIIWRNCTEANQHWCRS